MGFGTVVATIFSIAMILISLQLFVTMSMSTIKTFDYKYKYKVKKIVEILQTKIEITNVTYANNTLTVDIENRGCTKLNLSKFDAFIYNSSSIIYLNNFSIYKDIVNPGIFDPYEIARLKENLSLSGDYVLIVCTDNGVCDSCTFYAG